MPSENDGSVRSTKTLTRHLDAWAEGGAILTNHVKTGRPLITTIWGHRTHDSFLVTSKITFLRLSKLPQSHFQAVLE